MFSRIHRSRFIELHWSIFENLDDIFMKIKTILAVSSCKSASRLFQRKLLVTQVLLEEVFKKKHVFGLCGQVI